MTRIGEIVIPAFPHHVTKRGNPRQHVFFESSDSSLAWNRMPHRINPVLTAALFVDITFAGVGLVHQRAAAEANSEKKSEVPQSLRHIFDLPWCKAWNFR